jgi:hypothetical protein
VALFDRWQAEVMNAGFSGEVAGFYAKYGGAMT